MEFAGGPASEVDYFNSSTEIESESKIEIEGETCPTQQEQSLMEQVYR